MKIYYKAHLNPQAVVSWIEAAIYASLIYLVSAMPQPGHLLAAFPFAQADKLIHFFEYAVFGFILLRAFAVTFDYPHWKALALNVFLVGAAYALSDEIHQNFVPWRSSSLADAAVDGGGLLFGMAVWLPARRLARLAFVRRRMYLYRKGAYTMKRFFAALAILSFAAVSAPSDAQACSGHKDKSAEGTETPAAESSE